MNEDKYIISRARTLPLGKCYMNKQWQRMGMAQVIITRMHNNGNITAGVYLVDTFAKGVKDSFYQFNMVQADFAELLRRFNEQSAEQDDEFSETDYVLCHNLVYGAVAFAEDHGFKPCREFAVTQHILEEDTEDVELIELEFGKDGKPLVIQGPFD